MNRHLRRNNLLTLGFTVVIGIATIVQAGVAWLSYNKPDRNIPVKLQPIIQIEVPGRSDTVLVKVVNPTVPKLSPPNRK